MEVALAFCFFACLLLAQAEGNLRHVRNGTSEDDRIRATPDPNRIMSF